MARKANPTPSLESLWVHQQTRAKTLRCISSIAWFLEVHHQWLPAGMEQSGSHHIPLNMGYPSCPPPQHPKLKVVMAGRK